MDNEKENIELNLDESNELLFKLSIIGSHNQEEKPKIRLVYEGKEEDSPSYLFNGTSIGDNKVRFIVPPMLNKIKPGDYTTKLEVVIGNKILTPLTVNTRFKEPTKVVVENVVIKGREEKNPLETTHLDIKADALFVTKSSKKEIKKADSLSEMLSKVDFLIKEDK